MSGLDESKLVFLDAWSDPLVLPTSTRRSRGASVSFAAFPVNMTDGTVGVWIGVAPASPGAIVSKPIGFRVSTITLRKLIDALDCALEEALASRIRVHGTDEQLVDEMARAIAEET